MKINVPDVDEYGALKQRESTAGETVSPSFAMKVDNCIEFTGSQKQSSEKSEGHVHAFEIGQANQGLGSSGMTSDPNLPFDYYAKVSESN